MKWVKRVGLVVAVALVIFVFGWAPWWLAGLFTSRRFAYKDKANDGMTPASFSLPYEDVAFNAPDGVPLKGWWVPAPDAHGTVILVHGLNRSRIEMVRKVPFLHRLGWNALLFDLRHHGASGGDVSTFGFYEKEDVHAATALARSRGAGPVVLWGVSLGAASATLAAAEDPSIAGLVCDSTYRSLRDTATHHLGLFRGFRWWLRIVPVWPVAGEAVYWMGRRAHFDPDAIDIQAAAAHLGGRPSLFVCNSGDRRMPPDIAFDLKTAAGPQAKVLVVPGQSHGEAYRDGTAAYESAVTELLSTAEKAPPVRLASGR
ncbi:MAG TPA: alpha/beta fold hydrolase [Vicinamibacteria bacterium]|nr:alpha/beta fold hydrolase [Vicinamibacteria bacterium]